MKNLITTVIALLVFNGMSNSQTLAFPGAEGGGMFTSGGRGGDVYYVNTLLDNDEGDELTKEGSLRWCLNRDGKKTVLFKVSGNIRLTKNLYITKGDLTIAGQSAPGDGICVAGYPVYIAADNIIVRYLRFRMGDEKLPVELMDGADAIGGRKTTNVIIDHCSISWGTDECSSFYDNKDFTMQWCIISESLRLAGHSKGAHGYGAIWGGVKASFHHNLLAHHDSRTPRMGPGAKYAGTDTTDVRNNVFYNWNGHGCYGGEAMHINLINNYYKPGPATSERVAGQIIAMSVNRGTRGFEKIKDVWGKCFVSGNYIHGNNPISDDNWLGVFVGKDKPKNDIKLNEPLAVPPVYTHDAHTAFEKVMDYAGCSKVRDDLDKRIVDETLAGTARFYGLSKYNGQGGQWKSVGYPKSGIIDSQSDLRPSDAGKDWSAWPVLKMYGQVVDTNSDGIPDGWLEANYPVKKSSDINEEGYTYLEVYLNSLVDSITKNQQ